VSSPVVTEQHTDKPVSLIEFPAELSVKAMGLNAPDFEELVRGIVEPLLKHCEFKITTVASRQGKYLSVRIHFVAEDHPQLERVYVALRAHQRVLFTL